jgi:hypothetical protein
MLLIFMHCVYYQEPCPHYSALRYKKTFVGHRWVVFLLILHTVTFKEDNSESSIGVSVIRNDVLSWAVWCEIMCLYSGQWVSVINHLFMMSELYWVSACNNLNLPQNGLTSFIDVTPLKLQCVTNWSASKLFQSFEFVIWWCNIVGNIIISCHIALWAQY